MEVTPDGWKVYNLADAFAAADQPKLAQRDGDYIVLVGQNYAVEIERANTHAKILEWTHHLVEKVWMTPGMMADFIEVACAVSGLKLYGHDPDDPLADAPTGSGSASSPE